MGRHGGGEGVPAGGFFPPRAHTPHASAHPRYVHAACCAAASRFCLPARPPARVPAPPVCLHPARPSTRLARPPPPPPPPPFPAAPTARQPPPPHPTPSHGGRGWAGWPPLPTAVRPPPAPPPPLLAPCHAPPPPCPPPRPPPHPLAHPPAAPTGCRGRREVVHLPAHRVGHPPLLSLAGCARSGRATRRQGTGGHRLWVGWPAAVPGGGGLPYDGGGLWVGGAVVAALLVGCPDTSAHLPPPPLRAVPPPTLALWV